MVDHECTEPADRRDWERLAGDGPYSPLGVALNEIWRCKVCGYEFELQRAVKTFKRIPWRGY